MKCFIFKAAHMQSFLVPGNMTIGLRKWNTNFRGEFLIRASKNVIKENCKSLGLEQTKLTI